MKTLICSILGFLYLSGTLSFGVEDQQWISGDSPSSSDSSSTPEGLSDLDWSQIRAAHEGNRHAFTLSSDGLFQAHNPSQAWITRFDERGFTVTPEASDWEWGLELEGFGEVTEVLNKEGKLSYVREGGLVEWFLNDSRGLEQGWTLEKRIGSEDSEEPLRLQLGIRGQLSPRVTDEGRQVSFQDESGVTALTYGGLKAWDSKGRTIPVRFSVTGSGEVPAAVIVEVDDREAIYPITIDPIAQQQAYLKASNPETNEFAGDYFGYSVAVFDDTVVVGAPNEDSNTTGVNGNQADNSAGGSGAVYVFVRDGAIWSQQAYLKASNSDATDQFGGSVAVSGDTLVVGARNEASSATGIDGSQTDNSALYSGAAYVFVRNGTNWSQEAYLKASNTGGGGPGTGDFFGHSVAVFDDTVVVGAYNEASNTTGVNGNQADNSAGGSGAVYVFVRDGAIWSQQAYLKASNSDASDHFGGSVAVSGDTVIVGAFAETSNATGVNGNQVNNSILQSGAAYVFVRNGTNWSQEAYLKASNSEREDYFGHSVAVSGDTVVVGAYGEDSYAKGVDGNQSDNSLFSAGSAYVFVRDGINWRQEAYLKASNTGGSDFFGYSVAISGDTVVIGASNESSNATGVDGNQADNSALYSGAAYVFVRNGTTWCQKAYLKASNSDASDQFGGSVAVSGDTVVTGGWGEDSNAKGVDGNQNDNSLPAAGAVYVFDVGAAFAISITSSNGNVTGPVCFLPGETATLTATPDPGFVFKNWSGDASGADNPLQLIMDSNKSVTANFIPDITDSDGDGLSAYQELIIFGTNPDEADTDEDGLTDGYEAGVGRFTMVSETVTWGQAKTAAENSGGLLATFTSQDEWDIALKAIGPDALDAITGAWIGATDADEEGTWTWITGEPFVFNLWATGQPDNLSNSDVAEVSGSFGGGLGEWFDTGAGISREGYILETGYTTDPSNPDTDGDGLPDGKEISLTLTNPILVDSDNNGTPDGREDPDNDGLDNLAEVTLHGSNPWNADSDDDGFEDLFEVNTGFDPNLASSTPAAYSQILVAAEFRFNAAAGVSYKIESSTDLENWEIIETGIIGIGARVTRFYSIEGTTERFYRAGIDE
jgi:hypothetical protein